MTTDETPATYAEQFDRLIAEGFERGARDERTKFYHPDGRRARLRVAEFTDGPALFIVQRSR